MLIAHVINVISTQMDCGCVQGGCVITLCIVLFAHVLILFGFEDDKSILEVSECCCMGQALLKHYLVELA